ncbi:SixA phosphatase family protein [Luedemannella flava]
MTIRTLAILRHAKADNPPGVADLDRPLTPRGHADATAAGAWLAAKAILPDLVICSPARRTRETWHGVALGLSAAPSSSTSAPSTPATSTTCSASSPRSTTPCRPCC